MPTCFITGVTGQDGAYLSQPKPQNDYRGMGMMRRSASSDLIQGAKRDWVHARDYLRAMWLSVQQDRPDHFVIAFISGSGLLAAAYSET